MRGPRPVVLDGGDARRLAGVCSWFGIRFRWGMDVQGLIERFGFRVSGLLWLPDGVVATPVLRFEPEPAVWASMLRISAESLALGCRRLWRLGYYRAVWMVGIGLAADAVIF